MKIHFWSRSRSQSPVPISGRNIFDLLIEADYLAIIFLIPLWFAYWFPTYNIFEFNKLVLLEVLVWGLLFLTLAKLIFYQPRLNWPPLKFFKKYWLIPTIFIIALSLSLFVSQNPALSFYGIMERQAGLGSDLFYFLWFVLASFNIITINQRPDDLAADNIKRNVRHIVIAMAAAGFFVSLYAVLQILHIDFLTWPDEPWLTYRAFSTFGQPDFLASWLLLVIPLNIYLLSVSRNFWQKFLWLFVAAVELSALFSTASRGGVLSLLFSAAIFLVYLLIKRPWPRRRKYLIALAFVGLALASLMVLDYSSHGRVRQLFDLNQGSSAVRINIYRAAGQAIAARPIWGYGLENGENAFIKYYLPSWGVFGDVGQNTDRAHNLVLDILLTTGVVGLLFYALYYCWFFILWRENLKYQETRFLSAALGLGATAYLFSLLFSFSVVATEVYFWLILAIFIVINFISRGGQALADAPLRPDSQALKKTKFFSLLAVLALVVLLAWPVYRTIQSLLADYYFKQVSEHLDQNDYLMALVLDNYLGSEKPNSVNREFYDISLGMSLSESYPALTDAETKKIVALKLKEINNLLPPRGYKSLLAKAKINLVLRNFALAESYLAPIIAQTPYWPPVYLEAGQLAWAQGDAATALVDFHLAVLNLPDPADPRLNDEHRQNVLGYQYFTAKEIATVYEAQGNYGEALQYYRLAYNYNPADFTLLKNISDTYFYLGDRVKAEIYLQHGWRRNPADYHWPFALAVLAKLSGRQKLAQDYLAAARKLAPQAVDLLDFQKKINN